MKLREKTHKTNRSGHRVGGRLTILKRTSKAVAIVTLLVAGGFVTTSQATLKAAACAAPSADLGTDTLQFNVPTAGDYTIWTRMIAPDTTNNSINLQVDENTCFNVGGGSFVATAWNDNTTNWVSYANGTSSTPVRLNFAAGPHTLKYVGTKAGVQVDKIFITADTAKLPSGTCADCLAGNSTGDVTPPTVNLIKPAANAALTGSNELAATAADDSGTVAKVEFMVDGVVVNTDSTSPFSFSWSSATVANGPHKLTARAYDPSGNPATSAEVAVTTNNLNVCTGNPAPPANLRVNGSTPSSVTLVWDASTPAADCQIKEYNIYRDGTLVTTSNQTTYTETGLAPGVTHSYTVAAVDSSNHVSAPSAPVPGVTSNDSVKPSVPANLKAPLVTSSSVALAWDASTDNNAVTSYVIYRDGTEINTSTTNAFTDRTVQPNTQYSYAVAARDAANNTSDKSQPYPVKTLDGPSAAGMRMYITPPTGKYTVGSNFNVEIRTDSGSVGVTAAQADISYPGNLQFVSINTAGDYNGGCPTAPEATGPTNNVVSVACFVKQIEGQLTKSVSGDKLLASVTFKVLATGTANLEVQPGSVLYSAENPGTDSLTARVGASYTLAAIAVPTDPTPQPPVPTPPAPTPTPAPKPTPAPVTSRTTTPSSVATSATPGTSTTPKTTTTIAPQGNAQPVTLPNATEVQLSDPVVVQTVPDSSQNVTKVEYYLNGKLIATIKEPPYSYTVKSDNMKNGVYKLTTKTYYEDGTIDTKDASLVVKNPMSFKQIMLQLGGLVWVIILVLIIAAAGVWFVFFRRPNDGSGDGYSDDGYMFGPNGSGPPVDPMAGGGPSYGPPPPPPGAGPYGMAMPEQQAAPSPAESAIASADLNFGRY
jgi:chitodextrinase